jgi:hypothetical protein
MTNECIKCGLPPLDHPSPAWHYEDHEENGRIIRTPVLDGHLYLPPSEDEEDDE